MELERPAGTEPTPQAAADRRADEAADPGDVGAGAAGSATPGDVAAGDGYADAAAVEATVDGTSQEAEDARDVDRR